MTAQPMIRVTDAADQETLVAAITELRRRQDRLPIHWQDQYEALSVEIEALVDRWLELA